jgi:hypothetical protein
MRPRSVTIAAIAIAVISVALPGIVNDALPRYERGEIKVLDPIHDGPDTGPRSCFRYGYEPLEVGRDEPVTDRLCLTVELDKAGRRFAKDTNNRDLTEIEISNELSAAGYEPGDEIDDIDTAGLTIRSARWDHPS